MRRNSKYDEFAHGETQRRVSIYPPHEEHDYVPIVCPHCRVIFVHIPRQHILSSKASKCKAHISVCPVYTQLCPLALDARKETDVAELLRNQAERHASQRDSDQAQNEERHAEMMAELRDLKEQLSHKRQCLTDVREWGRLKEPDNTLVPQLTCREATLVASHQAEASRLRAELEVLRIAVKDKAPAALVTRAAEAETKLSRLQKEWDAFREENNRTLADAVRSNGEERSRHGAAKLAYAEKARSLKRKLQAAIHPDKVPREVRQWATHIFQQVFDSS